MLCPLTGAHCLWQGDWFTFLNEGMYAFHQLYLIPDLEAEHFFYISCTLLVYLAFTWNLHSYWVIAYLLKKIFATKPVIRCYLALSYWKRINTLITCCDAQGWKNRQSHTLLIGLQVGLCSMEGNLAVPMKIEKIHTVKQWLLAPTQCQQNSQFGVWWRRKLLNSNSLWYSKALKIA